MSDEFKLGYELGKQARPALIDRPANVKHSEQAKKKGDKIIGVICGYFAISKSTLFRRSRARDVVYPRQLSHYFLKIHAGMQLTKIGSMFTLDHASVLHSVRVIDKLLDAKDETVAFDVCQILKIVDNIQTK